MTVQPFTVNIADETLDDLRERLARTRWPDQVDGADWDYGTNLDYLKELVSYWQNEYDWRAQEASINQFANYRADIDGFGIHFIHERGKGPNPTPILILHGWPSTFYNNLKLIPLLTDPAKHGGDAADSFDVVIGSLPGFGFSDKYHQRGMDVAKMAELFARLMRDELGYSTFAAQGGDIGAGVVIQLAFDFPELMVGIHSEGFRPIGNNAEAFENLSDAEKKYMAEGQQWGMMEGGYAMIQSTKPQTLAYALNDSPAGLAGWIVEKWRSWSDSNGDVESSFTKDELLTNITIYWVTETINSSIRVYYEMAHNPPPRKPTDRTDVPAAIANFVHGLLPAPREMVERNLNVQQWSELPHGGHFPGMEEPELLADDIRAFFRPLRG